jgi:hypothetical protein
VQHENTELVQLWDLAEKEGLSPVLAMVGTLDPDRAFAGGESTESLIEFGIQFFNNAVPAIKKAVCENDAVKQLSEATAKDLLPYVLGLLKLEFATAIATALAVIVVKQCLKGACGKPLSGQ